MQKNVEIYTDGSCEPNPGNGGWAYVLYKGNETIIEWGTEEKVTNNKKDIMSVLYAMYGVGENENVIIYSDSKYCVDGINSWMHKWKKKGWKRKRPGDLKNVELWEEIYDEKKLKPKIIIKCRTCNIITLDKGAIIEILLK